VITAQEFRYWTRGHINDKREFKIPRRPGDGFDWLKANWAGVDEYAAVFSDQQINGSSFDTILMDVDAHAEGECWQTKVKELLGKCEVPPSRLYTTGRGAHLYWDLESPIEGTGRYKQVVASLVKKWDIGKLVDSHVVGDVRRMARLPMSKNSKGGYMVRIDESAIDEPLDNMMVFLNAGGVAVETLTAKEPRTVVIVVGESKDAEREFSPSPAAQHLYEESAYPPCIRVGIKTMMQTGELDHTERLHLFSFLVQNGEKQKGWNLLKDYAGDFNPAISEYQLGYIERMNLNPFKCSRVPNTVCPYVERRDCAYWPSISLHRRRQLGQEGSNGSPG
jgi:hypothetical protein